MNFKLGPYRTKRDERRTEREDPIDKKRETRSMRRQRGRVKQDDERRPEDGRMAGRMDWVAYGQANTKPGARAE